MPHFKKSILIAIIQEKLFIKIKIQIHKLKQY